MPLEVLEVSVNHSTRTSIAYTAGAGASHPVLLVNLPCGLSPPRLLVSMAARDEVVLQNALPVVERALGYSFRDRRLLLTALTHRSFCNETDTASGDFDELEWLGDSVLQLAISSWLFRSAKGSRRSSGQLSATRQRFVDAGACEAFAVKLNLVRGAASRRI